MLVDESVSYIRPSLLPKSLNESVADNFEYELDEVLLRMKEVSPLKVEKLIQ